VGIAISEDAYSAMRNGAIEDIWMPTDLVTQEIRLVSAVTKIQSKDFFSIAKSPFHASTVRNLDWCNPQNSARYWIDYVLLTEFEVSELNCYYKSFGAGNLLVLQVNETPGSYEVFPTGEGRGECKIRVYPENQSLRIMVNKCLESEVSTGLINLPLHINSNLRVMESGKRVNIYDNKGFIQLNDFNFSRENIVIVVIEPSLFVMAKIISIWILHLLIMLIAFGKVLQRGRKWYAVKRSHF
jgi:hypothetical protein